MLANKRLISPKILRYLPLGVLLLAIITATALWLAQEKSSKSPDRPLPSLIDESTLDALSITSTPIDRSHLAEGVTPPTNKWFSGFVLQAEPKPGYNYPNSFLPRSNGFEFSLPKVQAEETIITGTHSPDISVVIDEARSYRLTNYDELVVTLSYYSELNQEVATIYLASGLPYVYISAQQDISINFTGNATPEDSWTSIRSNDIHYGVNIGSNDNRFSLSAGSNASFFSAPSEGQLSTIASYASAIVTSGKVSYKRQGNDFITTLTYTTLDDKPTLYGRLPHQQTTDDSEVIYQSILGDIKTEAGREFSFTSPNIPVTDKLDLSNLSDEQKDILKSQLDDDVAMFSNHQDTYFGGKQLYRMAQLLVIAKQLGEEEPAGRAQALLRQELDTWLELGKNAPKSFLYDPLMQGIVGNEASFGSDKEFNDHHFHYGYFIYAAAILAQYDSDFLDEHKDTVNLLVADIANYNPDEQLPLRRSFDAYAGHSWASGIVPFTDGNNQESTSEAINAWIGTALWARQIGNEALELQSEWMLSQEHLTAQSYWLLNQETSDYLSTYSSPIVSIVWGGKREYATFFSDEANAKLAIQLLPLSPTIRKLNNPMPKERLEGTSTNQVYGDHILMAQPNPMLQEAINLPEASIDDGNSRTYLYAYILSKQ